MLNTSVWQSNIAALGVKEPFAKAPPPETAHREARRTLGGWDVGPPPTRTPRPPAGPPPPAALAKAGVDLRADVQEMVAQAVAGAAAHLVSPASSGSAADHVSLITDDDEDGGVTVVGGVPAEPPSQGPEDTDNDADSPESEGWPTR